MIITCRRALPRGAGTNLTTVVRHRGQSTSLVVADASYFQDGYGLSNPYSTVKGDCIAVGTASNRLCYEGQLHDQHIDVASSPISRDGTGYVSL